MVLLVTESCTTEIFFFAAGRAGEKKQKWNTGAESASKEVICLF